VLGGAELGKDSVLTAGSGLTVGSVLVAGPVPTIVVLVKLESLDGTEGVVSGGGGVRVESVGVPTGADSSEFGAKGAVPVSWLL